MKRMLWSCVALAVCLVASGRRAAIAQGTTSCDSPCKVIPLPLVGARGAVCDTPCKLQHMPLVHPADRPVANSNPLEELQGKVQSADGAYFEYQVDKPAAQVPGNPFSQPPDSSKAPTVDGQVLASFVVDTLGRAELNSLRILKSTSPVFSAAVRARIPQMRFTPAEKGGVKVRQLVQQPFVFTVVGRAPKP